MALKNTYFVLLENKEDRLNMLAPKIKKFWSAMVGFDDIRQILSNFLMATSR